MKTLRSLYLWTIGVLYFACIAVLLLVLLVLLPPQRIYPLVRKAFRLQLALMGIRVTIEGWENIEPGRSYLVMGNHESLFDIFIFPVAIPFFLVAVEASHHFTMPVWGSLVRRWGCLPIHRHNTKQAIRDLVRAKKVIEAGTSVIILPEGHRTLTGQVEQFKKGPFHLALATGATILPFGMKGLFTFKNKHSWHLNPTPVSLAFGKPIPFSDYKDDSVKQLRDRIRETVIRLKESCG